MIIPFQKISADGLQGLVEEYINREGTDYGSVETSLDSKVAQVMLQLQRGEVQVVFDAESESASLMTKGQIKQAQQPRAERTDDFADFDQSVSTAQAQRQDAFDEYSQLPGDEDTGAAQGRDTGGDW